MFNEFEGLVFKYDPLPSISFLFHAPTPKNPMRTRMPPTPSSLQSSRLKKEPSVGVYSRRFGPSSWLYCWFSKQCIDLSTPLVCHFCSVDPAVKAVCVKTGLEALLRISSVFEKTSVKGVIMSQVRPAWFYLDRIESHLLNFFR